LSLTGGGSDADFSFASKDEATAIKIAITRIGFVATYYMPETFPSQCNPTRRLFHRIIFVVAM
jgi:hypothetical protein